MNLISKRRPSNTEFGKITNFADFAYPPPKPFQDIFENYL